MNPAEWSEDLLSAYLDDELDPETRSLVEEHLARTPASRQAVAELRAARDAVRSLPEVDLSPEAWEQVVAAVRADETSVGVGAPAPVASWRRRDRRAPTRWARVGAAAAGAAAAAAVLAVVFLPGPSRVTPHVATFSTEHSARASLASDPVSTLAGVSAMRGLGR